MIIGVLSLLAGLSAVLFALFQKTGRETTAAAWRTVPQSVRRWGPQVREFSDQWGVPEAVIFSVLWAENRGNMLPDGSDGEKGIMQIKPIAVQDLRLNGYQVADNWDRDPVENIKTGVKVLHLFRRREQNWTDTIEAYNQGNTGRHLYPVRAETYLKKVTEKLKLLPYEQFE